MNRRVIQLSNKPPSLPISICFPRGFTSTVLSVESERVTNLEYVRQSDERNFSYEPERSVTNTRIICLSFQKWWTGNVTVLPGFLRISTFVFYRVREGWIWSIIFGRRGFLWLSKRYIVLKSVTFSRNVPPLRSNSKHTCDDRMQFAVSFGTLPCAGRRDQRLVSDVLPWNCGKVDSECYPTAFPRD